MGSQLYWLAPLSSVLKRTNSLTACPDYIYVICHFISVLLILLQFFSSFLANDSRSSLALIIVKNPSSTDGYSFYNRCLYRFLYGQLRGRTSAAGNKLNLTITFVLFYTHELLLQIRHIMIVCPINFGSAGSSHSHPSVLQS